MLFNFRSHFMRVPKGVNELDVFTRLVILKGCASAIPQDFDRALSMCLVVFTMNHTQVFPVQNDKPQALEVSVVQQNIVVNLYKRRVVVIKPCAPQRYVRVLMFAPLPPHQGRKNSVRGPVGKIRGVGAVVNHAHPEAIRHRGDQTVEGVLLNWPIKRVILAVQPVLVGKIVIVKVAVVCPGGVKRKLRLGKGSIVSPTLFDNRAVMKARVKRRDPC